MDDDKRTNIEYHKSRGNAFRLSCHVSANQCYVSLSESFNILSTAVASVIRYKLCVSVAYQAQKLSFITSTFIQQLNASREPYIAHHYCLS